MIKAQIKSVDNGNSLKIDEEGAIGAIVHPHPPLVEVIDVLPFRQYFTDTGVMTGSNDMTVNGSSTSVDFYISASTIVTGKHCLNGNTSMTSTKGG